MTEPVTAQAVDVDLREADSARDTYPRNLARD